MRRSPLSFVVLVAAALAACGGAPKDKREFRDATSPDVTCPTTTSVGGVDVSSYQGANIDWGAGADGGVKFGIAKATEGLTLVDPDFATNWAGMKAHGVVRGAYHFFHGYDDGTAQADFFLKTVGALGEDGDLLPVIDWEDEAEIAAHGLTAAQVIAQAQKFIDEIKLKTGLDTVIYTYPSYWKSDMGSPAQFLRHPLWMAAYNGSLTACPTVLAPWSKYWMWQYAGDATGTTTPKNPYPGVSGEDLNVFNGTVDELRGWSTAPAAQSTGNDALTAVNWADQHVEVFGRSPAGGLIHAGTSGSGDVWSTNNLLGSGVACGSAAAAWGPPALVPEIFSPTTAGAVGEVLYSGGSWDPLAAFGGAGYSQLTTAVGNDGAARVFALGADAAIWVNAWNGSSNAWSGWTSLGGKMSTGAGAITWGNGTIEIFAVDAAGLLWHRNTDGKALGGWSPWAQLGGNANLVSRPVAVRWSDGKAGHAEVFARDASNHIAHSEYSYTSGWATPVAVSATTEIVGMPTVLMNPASSSIAGPELFARNSAGQVLHATRSGAGYSAFTQLGDQLSASDPLAWIRGDKTAELFAVDAAGKLVRTRRSAGGTWGSWSAIASSFDPCSGAPIITAPDAGTDAGPDAGVDAGNDAGLDAGPDGGVDAGNDAGSDAGNDAGADAGPDAGVDAGHDAGISDGGHTDAGAHDAGVDAGSSSAAPSSGCSGLGSSSASILGLLAFAFTLRKRRVCMNSAT
jgi:lysozyme